MESLSYKSSRATYPPPLQVVVDYFQMIMIICSLSPAFLKVVVLKYSGMCRHQKSLLLQPLLYVLLPLPLHTTLWKALGETTYHFLNATITIRVIKWKGL